MKSRIQLSDHFTYKKTNPLCYFSMLIYVTIATSLLLSTTGFLCMRQIFSLPGAGGELLEYCVVYGRILFVSQTAFILQNVFQSFFPTAEKPSLSLKGSSFFTALGDSIVSAAISFLRMFLFQIAAILLLPYFLGLNGVWLAIVAAELLALVVTLTFFATKKSRYHYA